MPWFVLAAAFAAFYARLLRANLHRDDAEDYIRTARAKGLSERRVILATGVRSAITPIVTRARPRHRHPARRRDPHRDRLQHPRHRPAGLRRDHQRATCRSIQGTVLFGAFFIVLANLVVDIAYAFIDPRVRYSMTAAARGRGPAASTSTPRTASSTPSTASPTRVDRGQDARHRRRVGLGQERLER